MIKALNTATDGLLQAERRATSIAKDILNAASANASSFSAETERAAQNTQTAPSDIANTTPTATQTGPSSTAPTGPQLGSFIQQFSDLRAEENAFAANAKAFQVIDETLGNLLDDEG